MRGGAYAWQQYGKLPIHHPDWNFQRLEEFRELPTVNVRRLEALCRQIEAHIPADVLEQHDAHKRSLGDTPIIQDRWFLVTPSIEKALTDNHGEDWSCQFSCFREDREGNRWLGMQYYRAGNTPRTEQELAEQQKEAEQELPTDPTPMDTPVVPAVSDRTPRPAHMKSNLSLKDLTHDPDSFRRQKAAIFRLARSLKRVPTLDEALDIIRDQHLFTGPWEQHLTRRKTRVRDILRFMARTFDAAKCAQGSVNVGKYDAWAAKRFPRGLQGCLLIAV